MHIAALSAASPFSRSNREAIINAKNQIGEIKQNLAYEKHSFFLKEWKSENLLFYPISSQKMKGRRWLCSS